MTTHPDILLHENAEVLAETVANRLVERIAELQAQNRVPAVVLTGGTVAQALHRNVLSAPARDAVDWSAVDFWFGDERFVATDDPDRNEGQARAAMLAHLPVDPDRVHAMPASDGAFGDDVDAAAAGYAEELLHAAATGFDVVMLGVGPDGHCASLFPRHPALAIPGTVVPVRDAPKPPPTRISLSMDMLGRAREIWFVASGDGKAAAVRDAVTGTDPEAVPASGPKGHERTLWWVDQEAAARLHRRDLDG